MINTSTEYEQAVAEKKRFIAKASCLLKDGTTLNFDQTNLMVGGVSIADGVTSSNKFDIGSAIINQLTLAIYNGNDEFSDYDFTDAVITVWVGMPLSDRIEWIKKGVFNAADPTTTPDVITLKTLDNMSKFDTAYDGGVGFPATLQTLAQYCCTRCGILLVNGQFPNYTYRIEKNPFGENGITYRAIIAYCALLAGCYARCNADGRLEFKWYDTAAFDNIINGGVFDKTTEASYQTGDNLDGGNFTDYNSGDTADGGTFTETLPYHHIYSFSSLSVSTEDVVITGIRVKASDGQDSAGQKVEAETYLCGAEGYILEVSGNPLIEAGKAKEVSEYLAGRVVGMRFRPFTASAIGDPSWEAGDAAVITDRKGNSYYTYLTNITYSTGGYANISCDAEPAARHSADRYAEINKIVADIKNDSQQKLSEYAQYVEQMNGLAVNAMGYYESTVTGDDGSKIHYMHDKPLLSESTIVYKKSIDGFFISRDGGKTYVGGMDKDANIVANVIAAIGISFDWAKGGTLTLGGRDNENGSMQILDNMGRNIGRWDKDGLYSEGGKIISRGTGYIGSVMTGRYTSIDNGAVVFESSEFNEYSPTFLRAKLTAFCKMSNNPFLIFAKTGFAISIGNEDPVSRASDYFIEANDTYGSKHYINGRLVVSEDMVVNSKSGLLWSESQNYGVFPYYTNSLETTISGTYIPHMLRCYQLITDSFSCSGVKARRVETSSYGERLEYCYEMPSPMFGDIGTGSTDEKGECYVSVDDIFSETVALDTEYQVFLQKEGMGELWVSNKHKAYFIVRGTPNLKFSWEIKAKQRDYEYERLESTDRMDETPKEYDYETEYINEINQLMNEKEEILYETA